MYTSLCIFGFGAKTCLLGFVSGVILMLIRENLKFPVFTVQRQHDIAIFEIEFIAT